MVIVEIMLSTNFCAVPDLSLVDPATTSGPTWTSMACSAASDRTAPALHDRPTVRAPRLLASRTAATTNGVRPLAATPTTTSAGPMRSAAIASAPAAASSSAPSTAPPSAVLPPAMMAPTSSGGVENVGGHSAASMTATRPAVPAPT